jgi:ribonuclease Z
MEAFVLGSGGMMPMPRRRLTAVALRLGGWVYLFDCGEGTQVPYKEAHLGQRGLRLCAITHLHADHCLGLPGMLMLRAQMPDPEPLTLVGPPGLARFVRDVRRDLALYINYEIRIEEHAGQSGVGRRGAPTGGELELAYEDEQLRLFWQPVAHSCFCLGYRLEERDRPGRFDPAAADALGIPFGPLRGQLQRGETVVTPSGATVQPGQVLGPQRRGRHLAFITDTGLAPSLPTLLRDTDLAFLEGMFLSEHLQEALEKKHLTVEQAATAAREAGVKRLMLVHLSPRYDAADVGRLQEEASRHHPAARVARDGEQLALPFPED